MESHETEDVCSKLKVLLKARNKITCNKEVDLPCALIDDIDLSDILDEDNIPQVQPHKHLQDNANLVKTMIENIKKLKHNSEREMDFVIDDRNNHEDEIKQTISRFRLQTEKLIKNIIISQVEFNECLSSDIIGDNLENKNYIEKHSKLVEQTCKLDRGLESLMSCPKDKLETSIGKNLKIENEDELNKVSSEIAQGVLSKVFEAGKKTFKNHQHLQAITQYNKPTEITVQCIETGTLDPFTRKKITKPVRNKVCTHIYDQESVNIMFNGKFFVSCPYIGCTNKHFTKKDLIHEFSNDSD